MIVCTGHKWDHLHKNLPTRSARPNKAVFDITNRKERETAWECSAIRNCWCAINVINTERVTMSQRWQWSACVPPPRPSGWPSAQHTLSDRRRRSPRYSLKVHKYLDSWLFYAHWTHFRRCTLWVVHLFSCFYHLYLCSFFLSSWTTLYFCFEKCCLYKVCLNYQKVTRILIIASE